MKTNRILQAIMTIVGVPFIPVQLITTLVIGLAVTLSFGLLLIPISLLWVIVFFGPLLGLSWMWRRVPLLRLPLAIIGIPLAVIAHLFVILVPSMGDMRGRVQKMMVTETWPYSLDFWQWDAARQQNSTLEAAPELQTAMLRTASGEPLHTRYLMQPDALPQG